MSFPFYMLFLHWKLSEYGSFNFTPPSKSEPPEQGEEEEEERGGGEPPEQVVATDINQPSICK